jgi:hypothetical protein
MNPKLLFYLEANPYIRNTRTLHDTRIAYSLWLFNDAMSSQSPIGWLENIELEKMWKGAVAYFEVLPGIFLEALKKITEILRVAGLGYTFQPRTS